MGEMTVAAQQYYPTPPINDSSIANFTSWIYTTQIFQSDFVRAQTSFYRIGSSKPERQLGTLYWQLNDIWAAPTWASIEYSGRWKMLHYTVKDFFKPVIVTPSFNSSTGILEVYVVSDLWTTVNGTSTINWYDWSGKKLNSSNTAINVGPINATRAFDLNVRESGLNLSNAIARIQVEAMSAGKKFTHESWFHALALKDQEIMDPNLTMQYNKSARSFTATAHNGVAAYVWLDHPAGVNGNFDDNGFWLLPGEPKIVGFKVKNDETSGRWMNDVTIRSLWNNTQ
jgi:beta-mannosidase